MNESQINEVENKLEENESIVENSEENIVDNGSKIGMKIFASILLIIIFLSIVFGLLLSLDVFSDDCDGNKSRTSIEVFEVREEYKDKGDNFVKKN